jgi:hypothetical protein
MPGHIEIKPCEGCATADQIELVRDETTRPGTLYVRAWCVRCDSYAWRQPRTVPKGVLAQDPHTLPTDPSSHPHPNQLPLFQR